MALQVQERGRSGAVVILELTGRLTLAEGSEKLDDMVQQLVEKGEKAVLLDLSGVPTIDSRGIKSLVQGYTSLKNRGGTLKLLKLTPRVREVLDYTRLLTVLEAFDDESAALRSF